MLMKMGVHGIYGRVYKFSMNVCMFLNNKKLNIFVVDIRHIDLKIKN